MLKDMSNSGKSNKQNPYMSEPTPWTTNQEKLAAVFVQLLPVFGLELIIPLIAYFTIKENGPFIKHHTVESLNFGVSMVIYAVPVYLVLIFSIVGWWLFWLPPIVVVILRIIAALKTATGEFYRYPMILRIFS